MIIAESPNFQQSVLSLVKKKFLFFIWKTVVNVIVWFHQSSGTF